VLASRLEGYGMVVAEALVRGLAVVATRAGAVPEWVPADAARLVEPGDRAALTRALAALLTNEAERAELAARALAAGCALPDWPAVARQFAAALAELAPA
jgi:glycosyltransferase involved in cell wall biosynthesis